MTTTGSAFAASIMSLHEGRREDAILAAVRAGDYPSFLNPARYKPVAVRSGGHELFFYVAPDYFSIGTDHDFVRMPMRPATAQRVADLLGAMLPTTKMSDLIWRAADSRLPVFAYPSPRDTTLRYAQSNQAIENARGALANAPPQGLLAGHKKDIVIVPHMRRGVVYIYGWHGRNGAARQPLFPRSGDAARGGHAASYVDYSHGVRLVLRRGYLDGHVVDIEDILRSPSDAPLLSNLGAHRDVAYAVVPQ